MVNPDKQSFKNEDLVLKVSASVDRAIWDETLYEAFLEELCAGREYQKEAIQTTLRYLLGGEYKNLRDLAQKNYDENPNLENRYGAFTGMQKHLQLPDQLSASLDLATGTGKSYVLYGIAAILLAKGVADRVLVLCPSTTIETGLILKFRELASRADLRDLLPQDSVVMAPSIINASETITKGSICVENYHAILQHVGSSIRTSLEGNGERTLVLNDEVHHIANESSSHVKKWKEFLLDPKYGFKYVIGVSGTCYTEDEYFPDVIFRYSLKKAIEEKYVKKVDYAVEMPRTSDPDDKWQLIYNKHKDISNKLKRRNIRPLTIIITPKIERCEDVAEELKDFLINHGGVSRDIAEEQVLIVHSNSKGTEKLPYVDTPESKVEWIVSVSMLNEGWDVKRVFQIIPHEERAFNSRLLVSQVLGRGLRIPENWKGDQPEVTVFNHVAWASKIRHLVNEILEIEKKLTSRIAPASLLHFDLHNIDYSLEIIARQIREKVGPYEMLKKGCIDFADDFQDEDIEVTFEQAGTHIQHQWKTRVVRKTYSALEVAEEMYRRLEEAQDPDDPDIKMRTHYTDKFPIDKLEGIVRASLDKKKMKVATDSIKQKCLQSLGNLNRKSSVAASYAFKAKSYTQISTKDLPAETVSAVEMRTFKSIFYTDKTKESLKDEQIEFFEEIIEEDSAFRKKYIPNRNDFKTPHNLVIADSENERAFIKMLIENCKFYDAWIKSVPTRFYEIDYSWRKAEHPKHGKFNPDFFIKKGDLILVIEVKGDEELKDPLEENKKKNEDAIKHFDRVNEYLVNEKKTTKYKFSFLSPVSFNKFFQSLKQGSVAGFQSELDIRLKEK
ncbi:MAG: DEAD/DEAH box helicase family protein [Elusimicrobia bacterium]|nr:DEAD/DEAH box helicase family protein [Elusimicrobiota bacterium]